MTDNIRHFAAEFLETTEQDWRDLTEKFIKGADFDDTLVNRSEDGIELGPLFTKDSGTQTNFIRRNHPPLGNSWQIGTHINNPDIKRANEEILKDLTGGADTIVLDPGHESPFGIDLRSRTDVERVLAGVHTDLISTAIIPSDRNFETAALLAAYFKGAKNLDKVNMSLGYAPVGDENEQVLSLAKWVSSAAPHWKALSVNARFAHEAGGSPAQELAFMLALGNHYIRLLMDGGFDIETSLSLMDVYLAADQDTHQNITKLRAARLLWAKMAESYGATEPGRACTLNVISSERMMAKQDPWSNLLRLNSACFGAVCGGADSITILPFTYALGLPTNFARRISRNIQNLMMEESHLGYVDDPAHGSFMHEALTHELAKRAWEIFQDIEAHGGWKSAEAKHWFVTELNQVRDERADKIASGQKQLIGVNQFVKPDVRKAEVQRPPKLKERKGDIIETRDFSEAVEQAENGQLAPKFGTPTRIEKVNLADCAETKGGAS
ncbi:MAG: hypothetical protein HKO02_08315 [Hyphomonadaceae bacterium]|nr:hypothetical protein [Hyphomonadaceae bacterium]